MLCFQLKRLAMALVPSSPQASWSMSGITSQGRIREKASGLGSVLKPVVQRYTRKRSVTEGPPVRRASECTTLASTQSAIWPNSSPSPVLPSTGPLLDRKQCLTSRLHEAFQFFCELGIGIGNDKGSAEDLALIKRCRFLKLLQNFGAARSKS